MPAPAQVNDPESFQSVFNAIPLVTKVFTVSTLLTGKFNGLPQSIRNLTFMCKYQSQALA